MKYSFVPLLVLLSILNLSAQINFDDYFLAKSLRVDYILAGNAETESIYLEQVKQEPHWGGPKKNLIDKFDYGEYKFMVYDSLTNKLIYSRSFCTLFEEWQTTEEAKSLNRSFYQTLIFPFPKNTVRLEIFSRNNENKFLRIFELIIDPEDYFINADLLKKINSIKVVDSGNPAIKVDIAFIAEGYTKKEIIKFIKDAERFAGYLFEIAPFSDYKHKFNIWAVLAVSEDSGTDIPAENIWNKTAVNSNFYTFDLERYLTTYDYKSVRDIAANVPYDQIYVLVNTSKYGGGGIFNHYSFCTSDNKNSKEVFIHEFGHGFAGLADEYYASSVAYQDFFNLELEPWQLNITTLVDFESKWKDMVDKKIPVPTPPEEKYFDNVGVFEGGGYVAKGVYRPFNNCRMKSNSAPGFCPVCQKAIIKMIDFYSE